MEQCAENSSADTRPVVMMVDDDDMTRMMGLEYLNQAGFEAVEAEDGQTALDTIQQLRPDIILMDVEMPNLDGYAACAEIRKLEGFANIPILMLTGLDDAVSINLAYEAGATDFTTKPINWLLLCHRIRYMLRGKDALENLQQSRVSLAAAQRIARLGNWTWHRDTDEVTWSDQLYDILGLQRDDCEPLFDSILDRVPESEKGRVSSWYQTCTNSELPLPIDHSLILDDGSERHVRQQLELERDADGAVVRVQAAVQDVTDNHQAERKIHQLAYYDGLTALPNRSLFGERLDLALSLAMRHERSLAVMFIDLDDFKRVNDTLGHTSGDLLLQSVGERLKTCLRSSDALGAGSAGTEIRDEVDAIHVAERILEALSKPYDLAGNEVFTTPSVGIAVYPQHGETAEELLKNADMAMYFAKRDGKNVFKTFEESMNNVAMDRYSMEAHELSLNYQPQMNLASGGYSAVEALLRWNSSELGFVSPADFIPLAEETGLIVPIGEWVLRTACKQAVAWRAEGLALERMAVNISVLQFVRPDFPQMVISILEETGLEPHLLELEITERGNWCAVEH